ncbi:MAG: cofactor-independent phosphoglycerate mutase [Candidatus Omnitrophica bacterium]|nr:cofactor-independent phosphoglycerate mutase [Candidatus Omnitrophota bacterium]
MKYIVIVPDGMADHPVEDLNNKTPLQVAHSSNMDYMAQNGLVGLVKTIPDKMNPGSDIGNLSVLGYDPEEYFSGRAPLEAVNLDIDLTADEVAFRCNLVTIDDYKMKDYSAGHIATKEAGELIDALNNAMGAENIRFHAGKSYRHLLILKARNTADFLNLKCTPPHDIMGKDIKKYLPRGVHAQLLLKLMEKSQKILGNHPVNNVRVDLKENPANMIWLWGQGIHRELPLFKNKYGLSGGIISAVDLVNGIGKLAGLEVIKVPGITGYYDTNYKGKAEYALNALKEKDFVFIHIEGPDEAGHNGDYEAKISCIEHIDREIIGAILNHFDLNDDFRILVLPDHPTPVALRTHTREPVGFIMFGKRINPEGVESFHEETAKEKGLRFKSGPELMDYFINKYI